MARISGVDIPREKRLEIALTYIFGIGKPTAQKICAEAGVDPSVDRPASVAGSSAGDPADTGVASSTVTSAVGTALATIAVGTFSAQWQATRWPSP